MNNKARIYLDDIRTPISPNNEWVEGIEEWTVVRNYEEFVAKVLELGLSNIELISLDHDLGDTSMTEYFKNVSPNYQLNYDNIEEKTGFDCCKWLINYFYDTNPKRVKMSRFDKKQYPIKFPEVVVHSANPIGSANMMGYINNFLMNEGQPQTCIRVNIEHTV
jgi:hypothetical protein